MLEEEYREKIEAMQIYVPLLQKLITKLEVKNDGSEENIEKISQLKILLTQLLDPKPGISFEELNECHDVMENLFILDKHDDNKLKSERTQINEHKEKGTTKENFTPLETEITSTAKKVYQISKEKQIVEERKEINTSITKNKTKLIEESVQIQANKERTKDAEDADEVVDSKNVINEFENIEIIEFSEDEEGSEESFEEVELILPDNEAHFIDLPKDSNKEENEECEKSDEKNEKCEDEENKKVKAQEDCKEEIIALESRENTINVNIREKEQSAKVMEVEEACEDLDNKSDKDTYYEDFELYDTMSSDGNIQTNITDNNENSLELENLSNPKKSGIKRTHNLSNVNETTNSKRVILWDPVNDIEMEAAIETVNALADSFIDPLAVDDLNLQQKTVKDTENTAAVENEDKTANAENNIDNDDNDDDVEIIETRNSPIIIDSDEEEMGIDVDVVKSQQIENTVTAPASTNKPPPRIITISNVTSLSQKPTKNNVTEKPSSTKTTLRPQHSKKDHTQHKQLQRRAGTNLQTNLLSGPNPKLFSTKIGSRDLLIPNAFYGNSKKVLATSSAGANPDAGHCRWLKNFLRHFCSPYNIAHNTCFLLLQRALREDDYLRIRQMHSASNVTNGEINKELLQALHTIFYLDGCPETEKLTFIGRKFCNLAFVNVLDKAISLTVDWRTNGVTSRTRLSASTLESVSQENTMTTKAPATTSSFATYPHGADTNEKTNSLKAVSGVLMPTKQTKTAVNFPTAITYPSTSHSNFDTSPKDITYPTVSNVVTPTPTEFPSVRAFIPVKPKSSTTLQVNSGPTSIDIPGTLLQDKFHDNSHAVSLPQEENAATKVMPRRSLRNANRDKNETTNRFIYSDDDDDNDSDYEESDQEFLSEKNIKKPAPSIAKKNRSSSLDISAFVEDFVLQTQTLLPKTQQNENKTRSFEMAFLEQLNPKDQVRATQKVPESRQQPSNIDETIVLLDEDEDDGEEVSAKTTSAETIKLPLEPHLVKKGERVSANKDETIVLLDEDEDDCEGVSAISTSVETTKLPLEPYLVKKSAGVSANKEVIVEKKITREKNIFAEINLKGIYFDFCFVCKHKVKHVVAHYVNMHPDCEVYVSRPTKTYATLLINNQLEIAEHNQEHNNMSLFLSTCVFCERKGAFTFFYWYLHFASHTGEYAYRCTGCGVRKQSRSLLNSHLTSCPKKGSMETIKQNNFSSTKIVAYMCRLCNYTQMNWENVIKHLLHEHGFDCVKNEDWAEVKLLETHQENARPHTTNTIDYLATTVTEVKETNQTTKTNSKKSSSNPQTALPIIIRDSIGDIFEIAEVDDGKSYAVDLTANVDPQLIVNEAENDVHYVNQNQMDEIGDVEGILQAYINKKR